MKSNKAITLIAVIITVIIMLILVAITINIAMDGELFGTASDAIKEQKIAEDRERLETEKEAERIESYANPETEPYPDVDDYFARLEEEGIINNKEEDVVDNGDNTYEVTTSEEHVFKVTETEDEIIIEYIGEANKLGPTITDILVKNKTTSTIEIEVTGKRLEDATYTYEYKKEGETEWKTAGTTEENTYKYTGLEANEIYNIRVKVENKKGSTEKETSVRTGELTTGKVSFGETRWENGEAKVIVINSEAGYEIEYQINTIDGEWTKIESGGEITGLKHGDTVYARLTDGTNHGEYAGVDIQDKTNPTVNVTVGTTTSNSIAVNVTARDNESGMASNLTYTYYIKATTESNYTQKASNGSASYTFTGLTQGITYDIKVEVQGDNAGNKGEGTTQGTTGTVTSGLEQGAITFGGTTWSSNKARVTISTNTNYTIEYQVNSITGTWTTIANGGTVSNLNHGDTVYARLTDGTNHGQHASTSITDGTAPTINSFTVTEYDTTSITVSAKATDNQSGIYSYQFQYKKSTSSSYTTAKTTITSNGTCTYKYTGLTDGTTYNLRVVVTDKAGKTSNKTANQTTEKDEPKVGDYVDYTPVNGRYSTVTNKEEYTGSDKNTVDFTTDTNLNWRIWSIDDTTLTLISDDVMSSGGFLNGSVYTLALGEIEGYNNGVKILNDICSTCYSNSRFGATARSIKIEDIENVLDTSVWEPTEYYETYESMNNVPQYTYITTYRDTVNKNYPYIYQLEEYSNIDGNYKSKGQGLSRSEQNTYYIGSSYSTGTANSYIQTTMTYWENHLSENNFIDETYYNLLFEKPNETEELTPYYLASRFIRIL